MKTAGVADWVWGTTVAARVARLPLIPLSLLYSATMRLRALAYRQGWRTSERLPLPTVAIGNLSVGGTGKTPLAAWIAAYCGADESPPSAVRLWADESSCTNNQSGRLSPTPSVAGVQRRGGARLVPTTRPQVWRGPEHAVVADEIGVAVELWLSSGEGGGHCLRGSWGTNT